MASNNATQRAALLVVMKQLIEQLSQDFPEHHHPWLHPDQFPELAANLEAMKQLLEATGLIVDFKVVMDAWLEDGMEISLEDWMHHLICPHPTVKALLHIITETRGVIVAQLN